MKIKTFGYKKTSENYLHLLEEEWLKMGHEIFYDDDTSSDYDFIFNIDRSQLDLAYSESIKRNKPLHCLILDLSYGFFNGQFNIYDPSLVEKESRIYKHCASLMAISKETGRVLEKLTGLRANHVGIPALSCDKFYEERDRGEYIYFFGRPLDPIKNITTVLKAINGTGVELYVSGEPCPQELFTSIAPDVKIKTLAG